MQGEGVYHLVGTNSFNTRPEMGQKLLYLFPNATNQIQAKPGDVVGFYLEDDARVVDDFAIQYKLNATGVSVQYKQEDHPLEIIQASTLPVQFLNVAPIILVEIGKPLCSHCTCRLASYPRPRTHAGSLPSFFSHVVYDVWKKAGQRACMGMRLGMYYSGKRDESTVQFWIRFIPKPISVSRQFFS